MLERTAGGAHIREDNEKARPASSDELIRQAREEARGETGGRAESGSADTTGDASAVAEEYARFLREQQEDETLVPPASEAETDVATTDAADSEPAVEAVEDADDVPSDLDDRERLETTWDPPAAPERRQRSWDPDWTPTASAPNTGYGGGAPIGGPDPSVLPPQQPPKAPRGRFRGWMIGAAIFVGFLIYGALDNTTSVSELTAGDCIEDPGTAETIGSVESVRCGEPHEYEVFAVATLTGAGTADEDAYPGTDAIYELGMTACQPQFASYVGTSYADSVYWIDAWTPVAEGWNDGIRDVFCVLFEATEDFDLVTNDFSARNSGR